MVGVGWPSALHSSVCFMPGSKVIVPNKGLLNPGTCIAVKEKASSLQHVGDILLGLIRMFGGWKVGERADPLDFVRGEGLVRALIH